jgi:protein-tyrosine phosphatase
LAHVERYREVRVDPDLPRRWRAAGAVLQMNFGSLIGQYGRRVEASAWQLLADGLVDVFASDYHARGIPVPQPAAREALAAKGALAAFEVLATANPTRLLAGEALLPVPLALR